MWITVYDDSDQGIVIKNRNGIVRISFSQIEYIEVINKIVFFYLADKTVQKIAAALGSFEEKFLSRMEFLKVHRSYLVNLSYVQAVSGETIVTKNGNTIPVARQRRSQVQKAYTNYLLREGKKSVTMQKKEEHVERPWRILLVDDEPADRTLWADILRSHGCIVQLAANGEEAYRRMAEELFDCVLLDVMLSEEDGFLLCKRLHRLVQVPVIFLSCLTETEKQVKGFAVGGVDYITKNTPAELFWAKVETRIRQVLCDRTQFRYGPLLLDLSGRKVYIEEKELYLTPIEFDLLWRLSEQAEYIFTPEELFKIIWGTQPWDGGQMVQAHMSHLRRKLDKAWEGHHFIETVWGKGYRFVPLKC